MLDLIENGEKTFTLINTNFKKLTRIRKEINILNTELHRG